MGWLQKDAFEGLEDSIVFVGEWLWIIFIS